MRNSESGPLNRTIKVKIPSGTTINGAGGSYGTTTGAAKPGDNVIVNWDENSFGPRGPLQVEASVESNGNILVNVWNWTANPITTGLDLFVNVQVIPQ